MGFFIVDGSQNLIALNPVNKLFQAFPGDAVFGQFEEICQQSYGLKFSIQEIRKEEPQNQIHLNFLDDLFALAHRLKSLEELIESTVDSIVSFLGEIPDGGFLAIVDIV